MQLSSRLSSIVSYAGLSRDALFSLAKQAFAQADFDVPPRFSAFLPIFPFELIQNMEYIGARPHASARVAASGFSIDPGEYHRKLYAQMPDLYEGDNYRRNFDYEGRYLGRSVFTVDKAWSLRFPQYQPFMGEKLMVYLLGGGGQAVAVPESLYPRGMGLLAGIEARMGVTQSARRYVDYVKNRMTAKEAYDAEAFIADYLALTGLEPVMVLQSELGRILQDVSIAKSLRQENPMAGLFTENAKRAEHIRQYAPFHYACDSFEDAPVTRHTARLCQPYFEGADFISDFWIPYQDVNGYINKQHMTLDMARLCDGYQIAPAYDPVTGGGVYPNKLLVMIVRDREISVMTGDALNNPAYGGGMSPQGMIGRQVFIHDSRELLRQRKLMLEETEIAADNTALSPDAYRRALALSALQELKGKLVDAMYRREAALSQMEAGSAAYHQARQILDERVESTQDKVERQSEAWKHSQVSGYDADISYLRRKWLSREDMQSEEREPIAFAPDPSREQSVESGYAMRNSVVRMDCRVEDAALGVSPVSGNQFPVSSFRKGTGHPQSAVAGRSVGETDPGRPQASVADDQKDKPSGVENSPQTANMDGGEIAGSTVGAPERSVCPVGTAALAASEREVGLEASSPTAVKAATTESPEALKEFANASAASDYQSEWIAGPGRPQPPVADSAAGNVALGVPPENTALESSSSVPKESSEDTGNTSIPNSELRIPNSHPPRHPHTFAEIAPRSSKANNPPKIGSTNTANSHKANKNNPANAM